MQYNPTVNDRSGEFIAAGRLDAARSNAQMLEQLGENIARPIRTAGQAAAGFAMGGPAGAAMAMQGGGGGGGGGGAGGSAAQPESVLGSFLASYANNKALEAKGEAYGDFMKRHGEQLGFDPTYLDDFLKKPKRDQAMIGDTIIGMQNTGNRLMSLNHLNQQAALYPGRGGGGGGAGGAPFFTMPGP